jgi:dinuclear metal center YbgI/SA1388 family protein
MTLSELVQVLDTLADPGLAEAYDTVGLLVGRPNCEVSRVLVALEVTDRVLVEAREQAAQCIITHHPLWFGARKRLIADDFASDLLLQAIEWGIALYATHTNLDNIRQGVNARIGRQLGVESMEFLKETSRQGQVIGSGMVGLLPEPVPCQEFLPFLASRFGTPCIRYRPGRQDHIQKIAWCGGSGSFLIPDARRQGVDAFITGDVTHHTFFETQRDLWLYDIGHWESEQYTPEIIQEFLVSRLPNLEVLSSVVQTNPVSYFITPG